MQDDQKRPTVEDQELAAMIANLNNGVANNSAPAETSSTPPPIQPVTNPNPSPATASSLPPIQPKQATNQTSTLPPVPPKTQPTNPPTQTPQPQNQQQPNPTPINNRPTNNFKDIKPTPGLPPLPTNPAANNQTLPPLPQSQSPQQNQPVKSDLASIKQKTLDELRPLVEKLDLSPEERFDTLLLIIRSTDDKSLISQAYDTAQKITDETKRAAALLDIIKEIDYFESDR